MKIKDEDNKFTWNDTVVVKDDAPEHLHPGEFACVCGMTKIQSEILAEEHHSKEGSWLYTIEFGDGSDITIPESYLDFDKGAIRPYGCFPRQNVKENHVNQTPNGPMPGRSTIRPATPDEIPKSCKKENENTLKDFQRWKSINDANSFSIYDYIFHVLNRSDLNSDLIFIFLELFWPSFLVYKGCVFLKENFTHEKLQSLENDPQMLEFWMNLLTTDSFFGLEDGEKKAKQLAKSLVEIWKIKLQNDFPSLNFTVEYLEDTDHGDYGLTFYQNCSK